MTIVTRRVDVQHLSEMVDLHVSGIPEEFREGTRDELLKKNTSGTISLHHSRIVLDDRQITGWLFVEASLDSSWHFHPPVVSEAIADSAKRKGIRTALLTDVRNDFDHCGGWIAQTLLSKDQADESRLLHDCGFPVLTELLFMERETDLKLPVQLVHNTWQSESWSETRRERFATALEKTYEGTRDCPELNRCRSGEQALLSHELSGRFDPRHWRLYLQDGNDAGIALLSAHSDEPESKSEQRVWEIVYLGVAAPHRHRGLAQQMLADLLNMARDGGADEVMLGVDVRNEPAIRLYKQFGFHPFDQRKVHALLREPAAQADFSEIRMSLGNKRGLDFKP